MLPLLWSMIPPPHQGRGRELDASAVVIELRPEGKEKLVRGHQEGKEGAAARVEREPLFRVAITVKKLLFFHGAFCCSQ